MGNQRGVLDETHKKLIFWQRGQEQPSSWPSLRPRLSGADASGKEFGHLQKIAEMQERVGSFRVGSRPETPPRNGPLMLSFFGQKPATKLILGAILKQGLIRQKGICEGVIFAVVALELTRATVVCSPMFANAF